MARINLSAPWVLYYHEVEAMFKEDPEVRVLLDEEQMLLKIYVESANKASAIEKIMPMEREFGNSKLMIEVVPGNVAWRFRSPFNASSPCVLFEAAFDGNTALSYTYQVDGVFSNPPYYIVFAKRVVQYFTDDIGDINGVRSTLYQDMAKEVFKDFAGICYCTDVDE